MAENQNPYFKDFGFFDMYKKLEGYKKIVF
jgi:hypothetical protein